MKWVKHFYIRLKHWEYWPFHYVYAPVYLYWLWLCLKSRSLFFANAANPGIRNGGFLMESKKEIYDLLPPKLYPLTNYCRITDSIGEVQKNAFEKGLNFPIIAKPDIGLRGLGVSLLQNQEELDRYHVQCKVDYLLQSFVLYPEEAGIFYCRLPGEPKGQITSIVGKAFMKVKGDGSSTIQQLLQLEKRYVLQIPVLKTTYGEKLQEVLQKDVEILLVPFGNHSRGTKFLDFTHLITPALEETIDKLCRHIPGFYFGRLDIRYTTWPDLCNGKNFSIIELNGSGSEPAHIYDPKHSIFFAWKEIIRHLDLLHTISKLNNKKGHRYMTTKEGLKMLSDNNRHVKLLSSVS